MAGYFQRIALDEPHKDGIWPVGKMPSEQICFVSDITSFKTWLGYQSIVQTFSPYNDEKSNEVLNVLGLTNQLDIRKHKRTWDQLGFGLNWRATMAVGLLTGKTVFSLPNFEFVFVYWQLPITQTVWKYLMENGCVVLVSADKSSWLTETDYLVRTS
jgi:hypothetical protein